MSERDGCDGMLAAVAAVAGMLVGAAPAQKRQALMLLAGP
jgi:hypothetical protein